MDITGELKDKASLFSLFSWTRPVSYWDVVGAHFPLSLITGTALLLSNLVPCNLLPLKRCAFLHLTGYPCPFCGFTRSFWAMAGGDWAFAIHNCPLGCVVYILTAIIFAWNVSGLLLGVRITRGRRLRFGIIRARWIIGIVSVLVVLNWAYRLGFGLK